MMIFRGFLAKGMAGWVSGGLVVLLLALTAFLAGNLVALRAEIAPFQGKGSCTILGAFSCFEDQGTTAAQAAHGVWTPYGGNNNVFSVKNPEVFDLTTCWPSIALMKFSGATGGFGSHYGCFRPIFLHGNFSALVEMALAAANACFSAQADMDLILHSALFSMGAAGRSTVQQYFQSAEKQAN